MKHELDFHQPDPWVIFQQWHDHALGLKISSLSDKLLFPFRQILKKIYPPFQLHGGDAMALATSSLQGVPSARMVLFKGIFKEVDKNNQGIIFYTNYHSRKAQEITENPRAASVFHWALPERQVRMEGTIVRLPEELSDRYWCSRPRESQIGAWASDQSERIESREKLLKKVDDWEDKYRGGEIPRPIYWGGFILQVNAIEFWEACVGRLHRRRKYWKEREDWQSSLLSP